MQLDKKSILDLIAQESFQLSELWQIFKFAAIRSRNKLIVVFIILIMLGQIHYSFSPKEYEADANVMVEQGAASNNQSISGLGSLLGVNVNGLNSTGNNLIGPDMYQEIVHSQAFLNDLVIEKIPKNNSSRDSLSLEEFFLNGEPETYFEKLKTPINYLKNGFKLEKQVNKKIDKVNLTIDSSSVVKQEINPALIFSNKVPPIVSINGTRAQAIGIMKKRIIVEFKGKACIIKVTMPDPFISAVVSKLVLEKLISYVTQYRTNKQRDNIDYLEKRFFEAELKYKHAQQILAGFKDNSLGIIFQSVQSKEQILSNEMTISFNIYNQFATQLEQARIDLKKETPLFTILEPISIPGSPSEPIRFKILFKYLLVGLVLSLSLILLKAIKPQ